jgi:hypothetical protein
MSFRRSIFSIGLALAVFSAGVLHAVAIENVAAIYFSEKQLTTLGEYFGGDEYCGRRTYLRTIPDHKEGLYLLTDLDEKVSRIPHGARVVVDYIRNSDGILRTVDLPLSKAKGYMGKALYIGLSDITNPQEKLLAWRVTILDETDYPLTRYESFLWRMPDTGK